MKKLVSTGMTLCFLTFSSAVFSQQVTPQKLKKANKVETSKEKKETVTPSSNQPKKLTKKAPEKAIREKRNTPVK